MASETVTLNETIVEDVLQVLSAPTSVDETVGSGLEGLITPEALLAALVVDDEVAVPPTPASVEETAASSNDDDYEMAASPDDEDALLAQELHAQELAGLAAEAAEAAEAETRSRQLAESAAVAMALHEQEMAAVSAAAERRRLRASEEAASEALVQELQHYEAYGEQAAGSATLLSRLQAESDAEVALQMQREENQQLPTPAFRSLAAEAPVVWPGDEEEAREEARAEAATLHRHLFQPSARMTGIADGTAAAPSAAGVAGGSYASAASEWPRNVHASAPAPPISLPLPSHTPGATMSRRLQLVVDGANVGWAFGGANGGWGFCAEGMLHCVEYWRAKGVRPEAIAVVLHSRYYYAAPHDEAALRHPNPNPNPSPYPNLNPVPDPNPDTNPNQAALRRLEAMGVLNWSPEGHDDDLFMLQLAADADAWVVSNDTYANHRHLHTGLRRAATQPRSHLSALTTLPAAPLTPPARHSAHGNHLRTYSLLYGSCLLLYLRANLLTTGTGSSRTCGLASERTRPPSLPRRTSARRLSGAGYIGVISKS